jgi:small subunit ribosomal protein S16
MFIVYYKETTGITQRPETSRSLTKPPFVGYGWNSRNTYTGRFVRAAGGIFRLNGLSAHCRKKTRRIQMGARIRLKKFGTKKRPYYRIVVMDNRAPRDGKTIEELGYYHPIEAEEKQIVFDAEKVKAWIQKGATASDTVRSILNRKNISLK